MIVLIFPWNILVWIAFKKSETSGRSELTDRNVELYPQFFLELITTQLRFYMVSPQLSLLKSETVANLGESAEVKRKGPQKRLRFLVSTRVASDPPISFFSFLFFFLLWNNDELQPQLLDRLDAVFLSDFFSGMNICPIWVASLSHHTLCVGIFWSGSNNGIYMYHIFHWLANKNMIFKKISPQQFWNRPMTRNQTLF